MHSILFVDDEESIGFAFKKYFEKRGYVVDLSQEYEEAQALIATRAYSLVMVDLRLTGVHGSEGLGLLSYVRAHSPRTRTVLITAYASQAVEEQARERGASLMLKKPMTLPDLGRSIAQVLGESA